MLSLTIQTLSFLDIAYLLLAILSHEGEVF